MIKVDKGNFSAEGSIEQLVTELAVAIIDVFESIAGDSNLIATALVCSSISTAADEIKEEHGVDILELLKEGSK